MTTSGAVTEYPIPFPGGPGSIIACPDPATTAECGPKGGVWFVRASPANAYGIVRFNEP